jgi:UDP-N-acetylglucosamine 2-epimerase (non-hydrolysing)
VIKILSVFGTRPEAIKMAPVLAELERHPDHVISRVCVTGQHRQMLDQVLDLFGITPDYDLDVMTDGQSPTTTAAAIMAALEPVLAAERPDWVLVQGDTTTVAAASLAAFYNGIRVGHVEAGLRTFDDHNPFPEEMNRKLTSVMADLHFCPTQSAQENLIFEGMGVDRTMITGNTVIDALTSVAEQSYDVASGPLAGIDFDKRVVLVTSHRRENHGEPLQNICEAVRRIARSTDVQIVFTVHPHPRVGEVVRPMLEGIENVTLLPPLDYLPLVQLMKRSHLVLTDSGGLQEEAPSLGVPVLVLRDSTERPEGVKAGTCRLVGTSSDDIFTAAMQLLNDPSEHRLMARAVNPYGDGHAAPRIVEALLRTNAELSGPEASVQPRDLTDISHLQRHSVV